MVPGRIPPSAVGITRSVQCIRIFDNNIPATVIVSKWDLSNICMLALRVFERYNYIFQQRIYR